MTHQNLFQRNLSIEGCLGTFRALGFPILWIELDQNGINLRMTILSNNFIHVQQFSFLYKIFVFFILLWRSFSPYKHCVFVVEIVSNSLLSVVVDSFIFFLGSTLKHLYRCYQNSNFYFRKKELLQLQFFYFSVIKSSALVPCCVLLPDSRKMFERKK